MRYCPACDVPFDDRVERCPLCGGPLEARDRAEGFPWPRPAKSVVVYEPPDEVVAGALVEVLQDHGIKAIAVPYYNPYMGYNLLARSTVAAAHGLHGGAWGRIYVFRRDEERARAIIEGWLSAKPQVPENNAGQAAPGAGDEDGG